MSWDLVWQSIMVIIAAANLVVALLIFFRSRKWGIAEPNSSDYFRFLRVFGLIFITVALYRTIFVASYSKHLVWYDIVLNSPFVVRCMAFIAELSFIGMITATLRRMSKELALNSVLAKLPIVSAGCIFFAQFFAYAGLITQYKIPLAIEETLWALAFISITPVVAAGHIQLKKKNTAAKGFKVFLIVMAVWCGGYLAFQCGYALPFMYFANLAQDAGRVIAQDALHQAVFGYTASRDFHTWGGIGFFIWHSGYFSICSWMTLLFMTAPHKRSTETLSPS